MKGLSFILNLMFPPFPTDRALKICRRMQDELDSGQLTLSQPERTSLERSDQGIMLGAMLCTDKNGNEIELRTLSGISRRFIPAKAQESVIYADPVVSPQKINAALKQNDAEIHSLTDRINALPKAEDGKIRELKKKRTALTTESLKKVFSLYSFNCADGSRISLNEICRRKNISLAPTGTGECCAPKLLDYAFSHSLVPLSMAEIYYGKDSAHRQNGFEYPPCDERCGLVLPFMLGLEIIYRDGDICVLCKEPGLLSVPGRGEDRQDCVSSRLKRLFPRCIDQPSVHRLDMETSGLMVYAFTAESHRNLCRQFENGIVKKEYTALIDGILPQKGIEHDGCMELYFRLDTEHRPRQIWDESNGKKAVTEWHLLDVEQYSGPDGKTRRVSRVKFIPHTGRTHQLRLAASDPHGFGCPIVGDSLYGTAAPGERMMLHASYLSFVHPVTGRRLHFKSDAPF